MFVHEFVIIGQYDVLVIHGNQNPAVRALYIQLFTLAQLFKANDIVS